MIPSRVEAGRRGAARRGPLNFPLLQKCAFGAFVNIDAT
jgi:hypothetical protein